MLFTEVMISILLALMGLVALTYFTIIRRIKEIGIRKVNGASFLEILILLNVEFVRWVLAAFVFALPAAWIVMHKWLEGFAFKTEMSWWIFALSGFVCRALAHPFLPVRTRLRFPVGLEPFREKAVEFFEQTFPAGLIVQFQDVFKEGDDLAQLVLGKIRPRLHFDGAFQCFRR